MDKLKSDGLKLLNPSGFAVLGRFTAAVKVTVKLKKSVESTLFELDFKNFARSCKLNKTPQIHIIADKSANKKARPRWSGFVPCKF
ncbi:MAG: hypothetical protein EOM51_11795 [Clostridia bacterium]|nr:hypothetical protein [Clostridia bacterium]